MSKKSKLYNELRPDVFVSYSSKDDDVVGKTADIFKANDIVHWVAKERLGPGYEWDVEILKAIKKCKFFLLVLTENSDNSVHVQSEVALAQKYKKSIVVFSLCARDKLNGPVSDAVSRLHWLFAVNDLNEGINRLTVTVLERLGLSPDPRQRMKELFEKKKSEELRRVKRHNLILALISVLIQVVLISVVDVVIWFENYDIWDTVIAIVIMSLIMAVIEFLPMITLLTYHTKLRTVFSTLTGAVLDVTLFLMITAFIISFAEFTRGEVVVLVSWMLMILVARAVPLFAYIPKEYIVLDMTEQNTQIANKE